MISVVVPTFNEEQNVAILYEKIRAVLKDYEIIFVNDGSTDSTYEELLKIHKKDKRVKVITFRKNFGQTAALDMGFKSAKGEIIVAIDADLQNDPDDIPKLVEKINQGYDVASGWRKNRKDSFSKTI